MGVTLKIFIFLSIPTRSYLKNEISLSASVIGPKKGAIFFFLALSIASSPFKVVPTKNKQRKIEWVVEENKHRLK